MKGFQRVTRAGFRQMAVGVTAMLVLAWSGVSATEASVPSDTPLSVVESLGLERAKVGRVTVHFAPRDRERALQLATLVDSAAAMFKRKIHLALAIELAALGPQDWFSEFPGVPYAIPWPSMNERLLLVPSSLTEGVLVEGQTLLHAERTVDFVTLHEFGHIAAKEYFRPGDSRQYIPVPWFRELVATYFAYAYVASTNPQWAKDAKQKWTDELEGFKPEVVSLDWTFMNALNGAELARTYGWYQTLLNLRAAELYERHGLGLLPALRRMPWEYSQDWTTESVLASLEEVAPTLVGWARKFGKGS